MSEQPAVRFRVVVEEGSPHGGLFELEQTTYYHVVDARSGEVVMTFQGEMQASLSRDTGMWDAYAYSGARDVAISADGESVVVTDRDGRKETVALPRQSRPLGNDHL